MILGTTIIAGLCLYFLPTVIATACGVRRLASIFAVNLVVGWTVVGWVATLLWVLSERHSPPNETARPSPVETDSWTFDRSNSAEPSDRWVVGHEGAHHG